MLRLDYYLPLDLSRLDLGYDMGLSSMVLDYDDNLRHMDVGLYPGLSGLGMDRLLVMQSVGDSNRFRL